jgi:UDP-N-acetylmuramoylalanine-D-glutamate ligase
LVFSGDSGLIGWVYACFGDRIIEAQSGYHQEIASLAGTSLLGEHNYDNALAAVAAVRTFGMKPTVIQQGLSSFRGVPHRLEPVGTRKGVRFYNDSAATIPEASIAALESFEGPVYLIVGGTDKELDFHRLAVAILDRAKGVVFLKGTGTEKLLKELENLLVQRKTESQKWTRRRVHGEGGRVGGTQCRERRCRVCFRLERRASACLRTNLIGEISSESR